MRQGISCFQRALATDSNYPEPHAGLAEAYALLGILGYARPADVMVKAKEEAVRALGMDETTSDAHVSWASSAMCTTGISPEPSSLTGALAN